jgi:hypothetical protein
MNDEIIIGVFYNLINDDTQSESADLNDGNNLKNEMTL